MVKFKVFFIYKMINHDIPSLENITRRNLCRLYFTEKDNNQKWVNGAKFERSDRQLTNTK